MLFYETFLNVIVECIRTLGAIVISPEDGSPQTVRPRYDSQQDGLHRISGSFKLTKTYGILFRVASQDKTLLILSRKDSRDDGLHVAIKRAAKSPPLRLCQLPP